MNPTESCPKRREEQNGTSGSKCSRSEETFVSALYRLSAQTVHVNHLACCLRITSPAASRTAKRLCQIGLLRIPRYGFLALTEEGQRMGAYLLWRYETVNRLLCRVNGTEAEENREETARIEHRLSPATLTNIERFLDESTP